MAKAKEAVNHPEHYNRGKFEVIDVIKDWDLNFPLGNTVKYIARAPHKEKPEEDLRKASWYLDYEIVSNDRAVKMLELMTEQIDDALTMGEVTKEEVLEMYTWLQQMYIRYDEGGYTTPRWYLEEIQASDIFNKIRLRTSGSPQAAVVIKRYKRLERQSGPILDFIIRSTACRRIDIVNTFSGVNTADANQILHILEAAGFVNLIRTDYGRLQSVTPSVRALDYATENMRYE